MAMKDQEIQLESQKLFLEMTSLMSQQLQATQGVQKNLIQLAEGQKRICKVQEEQLKVQESQLEVQQSLKKDIEFLLQNAEKQAPHQQTQLDEIQKIREAAEAISEKTHHMEYRQFLNSSEYKDSMRGLHQFSKGDLWSLSSAQCKGIQSALEVGCGSYGDIVFQNDKRRAEHNVIHQHFQAALPDDPLWQTGCIALRQPRVQHHLLQNGVPPHLLERFQPGMGLLEKLRESSPMADTEGKPMTPEAIADWERKCQFDENRGLSADGWASASQVSADIQSAVTVPTVQEQQMNQDVPDSDML